MSIYIKKCIVCVLRVLFRVFWLVPINKNKLFFLSFDGVQYSDSPKVMSEYLLKVAPEYKQYWGVNSFDIVEFNRDIVFVKKPSLSYVYHLLTSKGIIVNDYFSTLLPIREKQVLVNTWHGGGTFKTVGMTAKTKSDYEKFFYFIHRKQISAFLSSSNYFNETVLEKSFLYNGEVIKSGLPRNDIFFKDNGYVQQKVYKHFGISKNSKLVLYAPTYRSSQDQNAYFTKKEEQINIKECISALKQRFGENYCFLFRAHHLINNEILGDDYYDATKYPNMQELLLAADVLISDYSSCMWDYTLMRKKCLLYAPDLDEYIDNRDFFMKITDWPYPLAKTNTELVDNILSFDEEKYLLELEDYFSDLGSYETGNATRISCSWILSEIENDSKVNKGR